MALGARLVADDRVVLALRGPDLVADAPPAIRGLIEARGIGLLNADAVGPIPIHWVVDMDAEEGERLPPPRRTRLVGRDLPLFCGRNAPHLASALLQLMKAGRQETP